MIISEHNIILLYKYSQFLESHVYMHLITSTYSIKQEKRSYSIIMCNRNITTII